MESQQRPGMAHPDRRGRWPPNDGSACGIQAPTGPSHPLHSPYEMPYQPDTAEGSSYGRNKRPYGYDSPPHQHDRPPAGYEGPAIGDQMPDYWPDGPPSGDPVPPPGGGPSAEPTVPPPLDQGGAGAYYSEWDWGEQGANHWCTAMVLKDPGLVVKVTKKNSRQILTERLTARRLQAEVKVEEKMENRQSVYVGTMTVTSKDNIWNPYSVTLTLKDPVPKVARMRLARLWLTEHDTANVPLPDETEELAVVRGSYNKKQNKLQAKKQELKAAGIVEWHLLLHDLAGYRRLPSPPVYSDQEQLEDGTYSLTLTQNYIKLGVGELVPKHKQLAERQNDYPEDFHSWSVTVTAENHKAAKNMAARIVLQKMYPEAATDAELLSCTETDIGSAKTSQQRVKAERISDAKKRVVRKMDRKERRAVRVRKREEETELAAHTFQQKCRAVWDARVHGSQTIRDCACFEDYLMSELNKIPKATRRLYMAALKVKPEPPTSGGWETMLTLPSSGGGGADDNDHEEADPGLLGAWLRQMEQAEDGGGAGGPLKLEPIDEDLVNPPKAPLPDLRPLYPFPKYTPDTFNRNINRALHKAATQVGKMIHLCHSLAVHRMTPEDVPTAVQQLMGYARGQDPTLTQPPHYAPPDARKAWRDEHGLPEPDENTEREQKRLDEQRANNKRRKRTAKIQALVNAARSRADDGQQGQNDQPAGEGGNQGQGQDGPPPAREVDGYFDKCGEWLESGGNSMGYNDEQGLWHQVGYYDLAGRYWELAMVQRPLEADGRVWATASSLAAAANHHGGSKDPDNSESQGHNALDRDADAGGGAYVKEEDVSDDDSDGGDGCGEQPGWDVRPEWDEQACRAYETRAAKVRRQVDVAVQNMLQSTKEHQDPPRLVLMLSAPNLRAVHFFRRPMPHMTTPWGLLVLVPMFSLYRARRVLQVQMLLTVPKDRKTDIYRNRTMSVFLGKLAEQLECEYVEICLSVQVPVPGPPTNPPGTRGEERPIWRDMTPVHPVQLVKIADDQTLLKALERFMYPSPKDAERLAAGRAVDRKAGDLWHMREVEDSQAPGAGFLDLVHTLPHYKSSGTNLWDMAHRQNNFEYPFYRPQYVKSEVSHLPPYSQPPAPEEPAAPDLDEDGSGSDPDGASDSDMH